MCFSVLSMGVYCSSFFFRLFLCFFMKMGEAREREREREGERSEYWRCKKKKKRAGGVRGGNREERESLGFF
jgi:hypothetical protein